MANNFHRNSNDKLLGNCVTCRQGIYEKRDKGQFLINPNPQQTGRVHKWCVLKPVKEVTRQAA